MRNLLNSISPEAGEAIVLMPLTRVLAEKPTRVGHLTIFPPGELEIVTDDANLLHRKDLVEIQSKITGFSSNLFEEFPTVGFSVALSLNKIQQHNHDDDITLLSELSGMAERSFDYLRLNYCRLDLPDTLPGPIGVWDISAPYIGTLIYFPEEKKWCEIAGAAASYTTVVSGIGLDLDGCQVCDPPSKSNGEVGAIAAHALSLLSDAMHARNDTTKFVRVMTLLEFLGSPDEYKKWQKLKGDIVCHIARDKEDYQSRLEELRTFTSLENSLKEQIGYRTLVVHHGKFLEEILPERENRRSLFRKLQTYCHAVIHDMINNAQMTWSEFLSLRTQRKRDLRVAESE